MVSAAERARSPFHAEPTHERKYEICAVRMLAARKSELQSDIERLKLEQERLRKMDHHAGHPCSSKSVRRARLLFMALADFR